MTKKLAGLFNRINGWVAKVDEWPLWCLVAF